MKESKGLWFPDKDKFMVSQYAQGYTQLSTLEKALTYVTNFRTAIDGRSKQNESSALD